MAAYVIVGVDILDAQGYTEYARQVPPTLAPYDGRVVVSSDTFAAVEGDWPAQRIVVLTFPSVDQATAWYRSAAYQAILPLRQRHGRTPFLVVVEGMTEVTRPVETAPAGQAQAAHGPRRAQLPTADSAGEQLRRAQRPGDVDDRHD